MIETASSNPMIATNIPNGIKVNTATSTLLLNIWNRNVDNIFTKV
jgi:hypothetical protein